MRKALYMFVLCLAAIPPLAAQQKFIVPGKPPFQTQCVAEVRYLQGELKQAAELPRTWNWVVVCDEDVWFRILRQSNDSDTGYAFSILDKQYTYFRGSKIKGDEQFSGDYIIHHELGHVMTHSTSCRKADAWAREHTKPR